MSYVDEKWKGVAEGHVAFVIFGGPSARLVTDIDSVIANNFTVTVNNNIKLYPNSDLFITADNLIAREFFEDKDFFIHKFKGGKLLRGQASFDIEEEPFLVEGKRQLLLSNPNLIKIIACNNFPSYNFNFSTGQLYRYYGEEYAKQVPHTFLCIEHRSENGESFPILSPEIPATISSYGKDPLNLYPGGNVSGVVFQLLYYMGFSKVVVVGYGDSGTSAGYEDGREFSWSTEEIHSMVVHNAVWGSRLKALHGCEICKKFVDFETATYKDLESNPEKKLELVGRLKKL